MTSQINQFYTKLTNMSIEQRVAMLLKKEQGNISDAAKFVDTVFGVAVRIKEGKGSMQGYKIFTCKEKGEKFDFATCCYLAQYFAGTNQKPNFYNIDSVAIFVN